MGKLQGCILQKEITDRYKLLRKITRDAYLFAAKYYREGRGVTLLRSFFSPVASFFQAYFFKLGFLDGQAGFFCAGMAAKYTSLKYSRLRQLRKNIKKQL